ncbi:hypothetical protein KEM52_006306 [Ascosphaera acerosa]|nr:hypothetical protein KEM52_006306 [Ascosphaera acerosa]
MLQHLTGSSRASQPRHVEAELGVLDLGRASEDQCHPRATPQRRLILLYLAAANVVLGRFPSAALLQRPEGVAIAPFFAPLCEIIRAGDVARFRHFMSDETEAGRWFARRGLQLQLRNRCEVLVWRSLTRRVFIIDGFHGSFAGAGDGGQRGPPPYLHLWKVEAAARWLERRRRSCEEERGGEKGGGLLFEHPVDPDFAPAGDDVNEEEEEEEKEFGDYFAPTTHFDKLGRPTTAPLPPPVPQPPPTPPTPDATAMAPAPGRPHTTETESVLAALITQDLLRGYLTHRNARLAIPGAKVRGALATGWPSVWAVVSAREGQDNYVPGWAA